MKNFERFTRSRHLASALAEKPVKGSAVKEAHDELDVITARLTNARLARNAWDDAYANAKALLEVALRRSGVRGMVLEQRLEAYFPARVEHSSSPEKPPVTPPSMPASGSLVPGSEGTKAA